ncbi:MAG: SBBP repeat-containing protein [Planctomycetes bacterium]|nr:SBBP repeat-containing protein [Planctomycetota bacterium]
MRPGVDVRARNDDGRFEFDLMVEPGVDLAPVEFTVAGAERLRLDDAGDLLLDTPVGPARLPRPRTWQVGLDGSEQPVICGYELRAIDRFGFRVESRRADLPLVIDPGVIWSTFVGGAQSDTVFAMAVDAVDRVILTGRTESVAYPTTVGAFDPTYANSLDVFVSRLSANGAVLQYSTFLGGASIDVPGALALDALGQVTIVGNTWSADFPTTPGAFDSTHGGSSDVFVSRLSASGAALFYSTLIGDTNSEEAFAVAVESSGTTVVAGQTASIAFPTTPGAFARTHGGAFDAFVARLDGAGASLLYSTFVGGTLHEQAEALIVDASGVATVAGRTRSPDFPVTPGCFDATHNGSYDAFVVKLSALGTTLDYGTYFGGAGHDEAYAIAADPYGAFVLAGQANVGLPVTPGAFDTTHNGGPDGFVARFATPSLLQYATYLGGGYTDFIRSIAVDGQGSVFATGRASAGFPTTSGAYRRTDPPTGSAFVSRLAPSGAQLVYSSFLAGSTQDEGYAVALVDEAEAVVAGGTHSIDFPVSAGAFDPTHNGAEDAFATRIELLPIGVSGFGVTSPGCTGGLPIWPTSQPRVGNAAFGLACSGAPRNAPGVLVVASHRLATPAPVAGVLLWLDPASPLFLTVSVFSDARGGVEAAIPIPADPSWALQRIFAQFLWLGPNSPLPCPVGGVSATRALEIVIQP